MYARLLPAFDIIDGGPNIDDADVGSHSYKDAFGHGYGFNGEVWIRFSPSIYLLFLGGMSRFEGGRTLATVDGYDMQLDDLAFTYLAVGGAFVAPISLFTLSTGKVDDLKGLVLTFQFNMGAAFQPLVKAEITNSPPTSVNLTGERFDYWKQRIRFVGHVAVGFEYRVGPFSLLGDIGVRTFGRPTPATEPSWWSGGATMITYPIRVGFSYRF
jgi:hypothetical protein